MDSPATKKRSSAIPPISKFAGILLITVLILSLQILFLEHPFASEDMLRTTFNILSWAAVLSVIAILLVTSPGIEMKRGRFTFFNKNSLLIAPKVSLNITLNTL